MISPEMKTRPGSLLGGPTHLKRQNQSRYIRGDQTVASDEITLNLNGVYLMKVQAVTSGRAG